MDPARLKIERHVMQTYFPHRHAFVNMEDPSQAYLDVGLKTSSGRTYRLRVNIPPDFPNSVPAVYVTYPEPDTLCDAAAKPLYQASPSHSMHLLQPDGKFVRLCHYKQENWFPGVTLYKVVLKCLIWLEAYQSHLQDGKPLDYYLRS
jgi:ubiquitin-protein ligase